MRSLGLRTRNSSSRGINACSVKLEEAATRRTPRNSPVPRDAHENPQGGHALSHRVHDSFTGQIYLSPPRPLLAEPSRVHIRMQPNATKTFLQRSTRSESGCERASRTVRQTYLSWYEEHKT